MKLRQAMTAKRSLLSLQDKIDAAESFKIHFLAAVSKPDLKGSIIACYQAMRNEVDLSPLINALSQDQTLRFALPLVADDGRMVFKQWDIKAPLYKGRFGQPEPSPESPTITPHIIIAPLLAFDEKGYRLGYGKGHYDGAIKTARLAQKIVVIGAAYEFQKSTALPIEGHDEPLDMVITEQKIYRFRK